jgi:hypothetical protein
VQLPNTANKNNREQLISAVPGFIAAVQRQDSINVADKKESTRENHFPGGTVNVLFY